MSEQTKVQSDDKKVVQEGNVVATNVVQQDGQTTDDSKVVQEQQMVMPNNVLKMLNFAYDRLLQTPDATLDRSFFGFMNTDDATKDAVGNFIDRVAQDHYKQKGLNTTLTFDLAKVKEEYDQLKLERDEEEKLNDDFTPAYGQYSTEEKNAQVDECNDMIEDSAASFGVTPRVRETGNVVRAYKHHPSEVVKTFGDLLTHDLYDRKAFTIENMVKLRVVFDILSTLHFRDRHFCHSPVPKTAATPEQITAALHRGVAMDSAKGLMNTYTQPVSHVIYTLLHMFESKLFPKSFWPFTSWVLMTIINVTWVAPIDPFFRTPNNFQPPRF